MNRSWFKRYGLVMVLAFVTIFMLGFKLINNDKNIESEVGSTETEEVVEQKEEEINLKEDYPLWEKLPYSGEGFTIERYEGELTLIVENRNEEVLETIKEINNWFLENNIATDSHRLIITNQVEN